MGAALLTAAQRATRKSVMPHIVDPAIETYLRHLYDDGDPIRREMEELASERRFPIVGPLVGRDLLLLARAIGARKVFELGSGYGYSALFFSRAVGPEGVVHCTELSPDNVRLAEFYLSRAGVWPRITYHREEATAALRRVGGTWDIVYNDIDKEGYPDTVDLAYEHLRPGGLFITDNVLWSGRILESDKVQSLATRGVVEFTRRLFAHPGFVTSIHPTRDGVAVALRV
jgi:predicted O-methyltransferase YrrM